MWCYVHPHDFFSGGVRCNAITSLTSSYLVQSCSIHFIFPFPLLIFSTSPSPDITYIISPHITPYYITSHHIILYHITSYHIISNNIISSDMLIQDFLSAVENIRPSVSPDSLAKYAEWSDQFGVSKWRLFSFLESAIQVPLYLKLGWRARVRLI